MTADSGTVDAENPWPGLAAFREADRDLFVGREAEAEELLRLVLRERVAVLYGLSGLGKTSLLQAGLFPRLRDEGILPVPLRLDWSETALPCTEQILAALGRAAAASGAEMPAPLPGETLWELFHRNGNEFWNVRNRPVAPLLAFDQFEEIFTLGKVRPDAAELIETLASLAEGHPPAAVKARLDEHPAECRLFTFGRHPYKILLSLREDFLPELEALRRRVPGTLTNRLRLRRMHGGNALRVVTLPGRGLISAEVAETVVRFVAGEAPGEAPVPLAELEVEPAILSVVCRELNLQRRARNDAQITAGLLEGSRGQILAGVYERSLAGLAPEVRSFVEEKLLTVSGFRDSVALENALASPGVTREAVDRLIERRLLRIEDRGGGQRLELTHDVLTDVVRASRDDRRRGEALEQEATARRAEAERELQARRVRELHRTRWLLALCAALLLGCIGLSVTAYRAQRQALQLLAASDVQVAIKATRPQEALAWLAHGLRQDPESLEARSLIFSYLLDQSWLLPFREIPLPREGVELVQVSPDGRTAAVLDRNRKALRILDLDSPDITERTLREPSQINDVAFTPDSRRLITRSGGGLRLWDAATGRAAGGPFQGDSSCLGPDCRTVLVTDEGTARFLEAATGHEAGPPISSSLRLHENASTGDRILAIGKQAGDWLIVVHDIRNGPTLLSLGTRDQKIDKAAFSPDGRFLFAVTSGGVQVWNGETYAPLAFLPHPQPVDTVEGDSAGHILTSSQGLLRVWDVTRSAAPLAQVRSEKSAERFHLSPDGHDLLALGPAGTELLSWNLPAGDRLFQPLQAWSIGHRGDGPSLRVTAADPGAVGVFSPARAVRTAFALPGEPPVYDATFSADARLVALLQPGRLTVRDTVTGETVGQPLALQAVPDLIRFVAGGRLVAIETGEALTWDFRSGAQHQAEHQEARRVPLGAQGLARDVSPDGTKALFAGSFPEEDGLWQADLLTGKVLARYHCRGSLQQDVILAFSPDGTRLLHSATESALRLVAVRSGKVLATLEHPQVDSGAFSTDGHRILTVSADGAARLWDATSGRLTATYRIEKGVAGANLSRDGRSLLMVDGDSKVRILDLESGKPAGQPIPTASGIDVWLSPDGRRVLVVNRLIGAALAQLWDSRTGRPLGLPFHLPGRYLGSAFSPDGRRLSLASAEQIRIVDLPFGSAADADLLIRWAEAVGGFSVDSLGDLKPVPDQIARLDALRRETAGAPWGRDGAASLIRWFFADPQSRPRSPLSSPAVYPP